MMTLERLAIVGLLLLLALWVYPQTRELARTASYFAILAGAEVAWILFLGWVAVRR